MTTVDLSAQKNPKRILIIGADSGLAKAFLTASKTQENWQISCTSRHRNALYFLDLADVQSMSAELREEQFELCLVFAAMTNIEQCERQPRLAQTVNCDAVKSLINILPIQQWLLFSTNQVFSGNTPLPASHLKPDPLSIYGKTKAAMECQSMQTGKQVAVVRLTKVVHQHMPLFQQFIEHLCNGEAITAFDNMFLAPLRLRDVIDFLVNLAKGFRPGIYHLSSTNDLSYYQALRYLAEQQNIDPALVKPINTQIASPKNSALLVDNLVTSYGFESKTAQQVLSQTFTPVFESMNPVLGSR